METTNTYIESLKIASDIFDTVRILIAKIGQEYFSSTRLLLEELESIYGFKEDLQIKNYKISIYTQIKLHE